MNLVRPFGGGILVTVRVNHAARRHAGEHYPGKSAAGVAIAGGGFSKHWLEQRLPFAPQRPVVRLPPVTKVRNETEDDVPGRVERAEAVRLARVFRVPDLLRKRANRLFQPSD